MNRIGWADLTITPDDEALQAFRDAWNWFLEDVGTPVLFSVWGDVFLDREGAIYWLNTGTGEMSQAASDLDDFKARLGGDQVDEWFLPGLVSQAHQAGLHPASGQCFTYLTYPIFAEGKYEVANIRVVSTWEHFSLSGDLHRQIADLPDGASIRIAVGP